MWTAFQIRARRPEHSSPDSLVISGNQWELVCQRDDANGPYYPSVIEEQSANRYRFFAGKIVGQNLSKAPDVAPFSSSAASCDGSWLALEFEKSTDELKIASDVFNAQRWFYYRDKDGWLVANSLRFLHKIAATTPLIDENAVPYLLRMGYVPEPFTPLSGVKSLGVGQQLTIAGNRAEITQWSQLPVHRRSVLQNGDTSDLVAETLISEVARHVRGAEQLWIPLSGGIDSRFLLACALRTMEPESVSAVTFGSAHSLDVRIGTELAKKFGVKHVVLPNDERTLSEILDQNFSVAEGIYWTVPDYPVESFTNTLPKGASALSGYVGDPVFGSKEGKLSASQPTDGREEELLNTFWKGATYVASDSIAPLLHQSDDDPLHLKEILRQIRGRTMMESYDLWYFGQHSVNRTLFAVTPARSNVYYTMPFISNAVLDLAFALPTEKREAQRAYFGALKAEFPDYYAIGTTRNHGFPIDERRSFRLAITRMQRGLMRELDERLGSRMGWMMYHSPRANFAHPRELLSRRHREDVAAGLERLRELPIFQTKSLNIVKERAARGKGVEPLLLRGLLTVSQWIKAYRNK